MKSGHVQPNAIKYLDPQFLANIGNLELIARSVVEGFITGLHKSPFHGFSVEFSQHRPYMPGDALRFVDWKVYGRTDRYYIKQFEEETNLRSYILLDVSSSMAYQSMPHIWLRHWPICCCTSVMRPVWCSLTIRYDCKCRPVPWDPICAKCSDRLSRFS